MVFLNFSCSLFYLLVVFVCKIVFLSSAASFTPGGISSVNYIHLNNEKLTKEEETQHFDVVTETFTEKSSRGRWKQVFFPPVFFSPDDHQVQSEYPNLPSTTAVGNSTFRFVQSELRGEPVESRILHTSSPWHSAEKTTAVSATKFLSNLSMVNEPMNFTSLSKSSQTEHIMTPSHQNKRQLSSLDQFPMQFNSPCVSPSKQNVQKLLGRYRVRFSFHAEVGIETPSMASIPGDESLCREKPTPSCNQNIQNHEECPEFSRNSRPISSCGSQREKSEGHLSEQVDHPGAPDSNLAEMNVKVSLSQDTSSIKIDFQNSLMNQLPDMSVVPRRQSSPMICPTDDQSPKQTAGNDSHKELTLEEQTSGGNSVNCQTTVPVNSNCPSSDVNTGNCHCPECCHQHPQKAKKTSSCDTESPKVDCPEINNVCPKDAHTSQGYLDQTTTCQTYSTNTELPSCSTEHHETRHHVTSYDNPHTSTSQASTLTVHLPKSSTEPTSSVVHPFDDFEEKVTTGYFTILEDTQTFAMLNNSIPFRSIASKLIVINKSPLPSTVDSVQYTTNPIYRNTPSVAPFTEPLEGTMKSVAFFTEPLESHRDTTVTFPQNQKHQLNSTVVHTRSVEFSGESTLPSTQPIDLDKHFNVTSTQSSHPKTNSVEASSKAVEHRTELTVEVTPSLESTTNVTIPSTKSLEPTTELTIVSTEPLEPTTELTTVSTEPLESTTQLTIVSTEPLESTTESTIVSTEPLEPTTELTMVSTEPLEPETESTIVSTEPLEPETESTIVSTEPLEPETESTIVSTEPLEPTTELTMVSTEPLEPETESTIVSTEPLEPETESTIVSTEPLEPETESTIVSTEPLEPETESTIVSTEPLEPETESTIVSTEPLEPTTELTIVSTEPLESTTELTIVSTEPLESTTELTTISTEPLEPETESTIVSTEPLEPTTELTMVSTEPLEPETESTIVSTEPLEPETESTIVSTEPLEPETESTIVSTEPLESTTESTIASTEPVEPETESTIVSTEPLEPTTELTIVSTEPLEPETESTIVSTEPLEPTTESTMVSTEPLKPETKSTIVSTEPLEPTTESTIVSTEPLESTTESTIASTEPLEPETESTIVSTEPLEPTTELTIVSTEPLEPETETTIVSTEPLEPETESTIVSTEPLEPTTELTIVSTEPLEPQTESTIASTEPLEPTTELTIVSTEPLEPETESTIVSTEPLESTTELTTISTEPLEPETESTIVSTEPLEPTTELTIVSTEPLEPETESTIVSTEPLEPETESTIVSTEPLEPTTELTIVSTEPLEPETESTIVSTEPLEPETESTIVSTEPLEPTTELTIVSTEPLEPETESTIASTESLEPETESTIVSTEPLEPTTELTNISTEPLEPETASTIVSTEPLEPTTELTIVSTEPLEPETESTLVSTEPLESTTELTTISTEPLEPETESTIVSTEPLEPTTELTIVSTEALEPETESTIVSTEPLESTTESTIASTEPLEPETESTIVSTEPLESTTESTIASTEPLEPETESTIVSTEPLEPTTELTIVSTEPLESTTELKKVSTEPLEAETESTIASTEPLEPETESTIVSTEPLEQETELTIASTEPLEPITKSTGASTEDVEQATALTVVCTSSVDVETGSTVPCTAPVESETKSTATVTFPLEKTETEPSELSETALITFSTVPRVLNTELVKTNETLINKNLTLSLIEIHKMIKPQQIYPMFVLCSDLNAIMTDDKIRLHKIPIEQTLPAIIVHYCNSNRIKMPSPVEYPSQVVLTCSVEKDQVTTVPAKVQSKLSHTTHETLVMCVEKEPISSRKSTLLEACSFNSFFTIRCLDRMDDSVSNQDDNSRCMVSKIIASGDSVNGWEMKGQNISSDDIKRYIKHLISPEKHITFFKDHSTQPIICVGSEQLSLTTKSINLYTIFTRLSSLLENIKEICRSTSPPRITSLVPIHVPHTEVAVTPPSTEVSTVRVCSTEDSHSPSLEENQTHLKKKLSCVDSRVSANQDYINLPLQSDFLELLVEAEMDSWPTKQTFSDPLSRNIPTQPSTKPTQVIPFEVFIFSDSSSNTQSTSWSTEVSFSQKPPMLNTGTGKSSTLVSSSRSSPSDNFVENELGVKNIDSQSSHGVELLLDCFYQVCITHNSATLKGPTAPLDVSKRCLKELRISFATDLDAAHHSPNVDACDATTSVTREREFIPCFVAKKTSWATTFEKVSPNNHEISLQSNWPFSKDNNVAMNFTPLAPLSGEIQIRYKAEILKVLSTDCIKQLNTVVWSKRISSVSTFQMSRETFQETMITSSYETYVQTTRELVPVDTCSIVTNMSAAEKQYETPRSILCVLLWPVYDPDYQLMTHNKEIRLRSYKQCFVIREKIDDSSRTMIKIFCQVMEGNVDETRESNMPSRSTTSQVTSSTPETSFTQSHGESKTKSDLGNCTVVDSNSSAHVEVTRQQDLLQVNQTSVHDSFSAKKQSTETTGESHFNSSLHTWPSNVTTFSGHNTCQRKVADPVRSSPNQSLYKEKNISVNGSVVATQSVSESTMASRQNENTTCQPHKQASCSSSALQNTTEASVFVNLKTCNTSRNASSHEKTITVTQTKVPCIASPTHLYKEVSKDSQHTLVDPTKHKDHTSPVNQSFSNPVSSPTAGNKHVSNRSRVIYMNRARPVPSKNTVYLSYRGEQCDFDDEDVIKYSEALSRFTKKDIEETKLPLDLDMIQDDDEIIFTPCITIRRRKQGGILKDNKTIHVYENLDQTSKDLTVTFDRLYRLFHQNDQDSEIMDSVNDTAPCLAKRKEMYMKILESFKQLRANMMKLHSDQRGFFKNGTQSKISEPYEGLIEMDSGNFSQKTPSGAQWHPSSEQDILNYETPSNTKNSAHSYGIAGKEFSEKMNQPMRCNSSAAMANPMKKDTLSEKIDTAVISPTDEKLEKSTVSSRLHEKPMQLVIAGIAIASVVLTFLFFMNFFWRGTNSFQSNTLTGPFIPLNEPDDNELDEGTRDVYVPVENHSFN